MDPSPDDAYLDDDAAMMKRPSFIRFKTDWLMDDPEWAVLARLEDEEGMDERESEAMDDILSDYRQHISE